MRDVLLAGADGAQDADLLGALQHRDISDDPDHDAGDDQRYADKGHQYIADHVDDGRHRFHHRAHHIIVGDHIGFIARILLGFIVIIDQRGNGFLVFKAVRIDADGAGPFQIDRPHLLQVGFIGGIHVLAVIAHELRQLLLAHGRELHALFGSQRRHVQ